MKVLLVSPHFPPHHLGGVELYVNRLADYLAAHGDEVDVVCVERVDSDTAGLEVVRDDMRSYAVHRLHMNMRGAADAIKEAYHSSAAERWIEQLINRINPHVLHLHSGYLLGGAALAAARHCAIPTVVTLHDFWFICARVTLLHPNGVVCTGPESPAKCAWCRATVKRRYRVPDDLTSGLLGRTVVRALQSGPVASLTGWSSAVAGFADRNRSLLEALSRTDLVLAPSLFLRDLMTSAGVPTDRIVVSKYGIDMPTSTPRVRSDDGNLHIGYLGQLAPHKGIGVLLEALRQLPRAPLKVHIYGDPRPHPRYAEALTRKARGDSRIEFHGSYQHDRVYEVLAQLDAIVVPSVWYENAPFVIQEAQAAHVPVIASRLGGMRELVDDERDGLLFEPRNPRDLARQLGRLAENPAVLKRLQPDGTSIRSVAAEMGELSAHYRRLLEKSARSRSRTIQES